MASEFRISIVGGDIDEGGLRIALHLTSLLPIPVLHPPLMNPALARCRAELPPRRRGKSICQRTTRGSLWLLSWEGMMLDFLNKEGGRGGERSIPGPLLPLKLSHDLSETS